MKKIGVILFLLTSKFCFGQIKAPFCEIFFDIKNSNINISQAEIQILKFQPDSVQKYVLEKSIKPLKKKFKVSFKISQPFSGYFQVKNSDTIYTQSGQTTFSNEQIKVSFHINKSIEVHSKQTDFYRDNIFLLLDLPTSLTKQKGFSTTIVKRSYKLSIPENFILQAKFNEYERNVIKQVYEYKDFIYTVQRLYDVIEYLSPMTIDTCLSILYKSQSNTLYFEKMKAYVYQSKKLVAGNTIPLFKVDDQHGQQLVSTNFYSRHNYTLLDFWASWCGPCRVEMKKLKTMYSNIDTAKFQVISLSIDESKDNWLSAMKMDTVFWKSYIDNKETAGNISTTFNLTFIPRNIVVDRLGKIVAIDIWDEKLLNFLKENSLMHN